MSPRGAGLRGHGLEAWSKWPRLDLKEAGPQERPTLVEGWGQEEGPSGRRRRGSESGTLETRKRGRGQEDGGPKPPGEGG